MKKYNNFCNINILIFILFTIFLSIIYCKGNDTTQIRIIKKKKALKKKFKSLIKKSKNIKDEFFRKEVHSEMQCAIHNISKTNKDNYLDDIEFKKNINILLLEKLDIKINRINKKINQGLDRKKISLITWNIWFLDDLMKERMKYIMKVVHNLNPDFVAFQEVKIKALKTIIENLVGYKLYGKNVIYGGHYDTVILSKFDSENIIRNPFISNQGRNELKCEFKIKIKDDKYLNINIITSHIESVFKTKEAYETKIRQLNLIFKKTKSNENTIIMGDTNFTAKEENPILPKHILDAFIAIGSPKEKEYTYNRFKNKNTENKYPPARFDRIYFSNKKFKVKKFQLLKDKMINGKHPSDHFGIYCELEIK